MTPSPLKIVVVVVEGEEEEAVVVAEVVALLDAAEPASPSTFLHNSSRWCKVAECQH